MSYLVLARKWRPRSFDTIIGQEHVVKALTHALDTGRLHHAWLFTGTRGVGKTTLARILAKSLNCESGVSSNPCGHCQSCTEIDEGRFVDYIELDAASNRGVDEMTQLLEQAVYAPSSGRYKVYMIDEVHMLTGHAFNAMLKTLEEPPPHVKFILATTDPQKIPVTVLSRCLQFNLKQMTVPAIVDHLQEILQQESVQFELPALRLIAQSAAGSMRDALSLTDQAIAYSAGNLTAADISQMLGTMDEHHLLHLVQALANGSAAEIKSVADDLLARGLSFQSALAELAVFLSKVAIAQRLNYVADDEPLADDISNLAKTLSADDLQLFYAVAVHSRKELSLAPDEYAGFIMACLRMLALLPDDRIQALQTPVASQVNTDSDTKPESIQVAVPSEPVAQEKQPESEKKTELKAEVNRNVINEAQADEPITNDSIASKLAISESEASELTAVEPVVTESLKNDSPANESAIAEPLDKIQLSDLNAKTWVELVPKLDLSGTAKSLALNCEWQKTDSKTVYLHVAIHTLAESNSQDRLHQALNDYFGYKINLKVIYGDTGSETVQAHETARLEQLQLDAEQSAQTDPLVQDIIEQFDAELIPASIKPN